MTVASKIKRWFRSRNKEKYTAPINLKQSNVEVSNVSTPKSYTAPINLRPTRQRVFKPRTQPSTATFTPKVSKVNIKTLPSQIGHATKREAIKTGKGLREAVPEFAEKTGEAFHEMALGLTGQGIYRSIKYPIIESANKAYKDLPDTIKQKMEKGEQLTQQEYNNPKFQQFIQKRERYEEFTKSRLSRIYESKGMKVTTGITEAAADFAISLPTGLWIPELVSSATGFAVNPKGTVSQIKKSFKENPYETTAAIATTVILGGGLAFKNIRAARAMKTSEIEAMQPKIEEGLISGTKGEYYFGKKGNIMEYRLKGVETKGVVKVGKSEYEFGYKGSGGGKVVNELDVGYNVGELKVTKTSFMRNLFNKKPKVIKENVVVDKYVGSIEPEGIEKGAYKVGMTESKNIKSSLSIKRGAFITKTTKAEKNFYVTQEMSATEPSSLSFSVTGTRIKGRIINKELGATGGYGEMKGGRIGLTRGKEMIKETIPETKTPDFTKSISGVGEGKTAGGQVLKQTTKGETIPIPKTKLGFKSMSKQITKAIIKEETKGIPKKPIIASSATTISQLYKGEVLTIPGKPKAVKVNLRTKKKLKPATVQEMKMKDITAQITNVGTKQKQKRAQAQIQLLGIGTRQQQIQPVIPKIPGLTEQPPQQVQVEQPPQEPPLPPPVPIHEGFVPFPITPALVGSIGGGIGKEKGRARKERGRKRGYEPSLYASISGITTTKKPKSEATGIVVRPIPIQNLFKKPKKKARKTTKKKTKKKKKRGKR